MPYSLFLLVNKKQTWEPLISMLGQEFTVQEGELAVHALEQLRTGRVDLMILDSELPDMPAMTFLRVLRETEHGRELPVIFVGNRKTDESVAEAFSLGVDDYLVNPVDARELLVRARAVLRRKFERLEHWGGSLSIGGVEIDPSQRLCIVHGKRIVLQPREFELLEILMRKARRVLTRSYLLETVWGMSSNAETRAVDAVVSRLRRRLGKRAGKMIETVSKLGYTFRDPDAI